MVVMVVAGGGRRWWMELMVVGSVGDRCGGCYGGGPRW